MLKKLYKLVSASSIAQIISFLSLPIISRLITPTEFGTFYFYSSIAGLIGGLATIRIEQLFFSTEDNKVNSLRLFALKKINLIFLFSVFILFILIAFNFTNTTGWLLMPIGILTTALIIPNYFYLLRFHDIKSIGSSRIILALIQASAQIGFCLYQPSYTSLLIGLYLAQLLCALFLSYKVKQLISVQKTDIIKPLKVNYKLLAYGMAGSTLNTLNTSFIPSFFEIFKYFDLSGLVAAIHRIFMMPINLVASSFSHIVLSEYNMHSKKVITILWGVISFVIITNFFLYYFIEPFSKLIIFILGEKWLEVEHLFKYFLFMYSFIFVSIIINQACIAAKLQKIYMLTETIKLFCIIVSFLISSYYLHIDIMQIYPWLASCSIFLSVIFCQTYLHRNIKNDKS